ASPAGDAHPALLAAGAEVEVESVRGSRRIPIDDFYTGVKRNAMQPDELIKWVHIKKADGPQQYSKVGTRNAMVIAVCAFGLALHPQTRTVKTGIGSAAPTPVRARAAEDFLNAALEEGGFWESGRIITPSIAKQFSELASGACNPIDDVRGTAKYRRHAVGIMARRTLGWTWEQYRGAGRTLEGAA
ncbi:MAG TPA: FAD binding domain-containing protein, partial [Streptomyces sp.]|nr:FAD binding domain-containing protein [Streptomyces sp.]